MLIWVVVRVKIELATPGEEPIHSRIKLRIIDFKYQQFCFCVRVPKDSFENSYGFDLSCQHEKAMNEISIWENSSSIDGFEKRVVISEKDQYGFAVIELSKKRRLLKT